MCVPRDWREEARLEVALEIVGILREALKNAFRHAKAQNRREVEAKRRIPVVRVIDDGVGLNQQLPNSMRMHLGIREMYERALRI